MNDSWCDKICLECEGVILIGDAAGWNDPIIGQGLAISMRDARLVSQILENRSDSSPLTFSLPKAAFEPRYVQKILSYN